mmetsp:Transcript_52540/g.137811  ORF Transcript_52540/g.137811 Transcript_52540/m.137811 type:complete len:84 (-) Transcript_52540:109-360(-)
MIISFSHPPRAPLLSPFCMLALRYPLPQNFLTLSSRLIVAPSLPCLFLGSALLVLLCNFSSSHYFFPFVVHLFFVPFYPLHTL